MQIEMQHSYINKVMRHILHHKGHRINLARIKKRFPNTSLYLVSS
jgi:hypothetical protein